jgi:hypothetical protein
MASNLTTNPDGDLQHRLAKFAFQQRQAERDAAEASAPPLDERTLAAARAAHAASREAMDSPRVVSSREPIGSAFEVPAPPEAPPAADEDAPWRLRAAKLAYQASRASAPVRMAVEAPQNGQPGPGVPSYSNDPGAPGEVVIGDEADDSTARMLAQPGYRQFLRSQMQGTVSSPAAHSDGGTGQDDEARLNYEANANGWTASEKARQRAEIAESNLRASDPLALERAREEIRTNADVARETAREGARLASSGPEQQRAWLMSEADAAEERVNEALQSRRISPEDATAAVDKIRARVGAHLHELERGLRAQSARRNTPSAFGGDVN